MKYLNYFIFCILIFITNSTNESPLVISSFYKDSVKLFKVIKYLQPLLPIKTCKRVALIILKESKKSKINWKIVVSILYQESSLLLDPQNCKDRLYKCKDFGIGQINYKTWNKYMKLNKKRLISDVSYSLYKVFDILQYYKDKYAYKELNWYTRYNSGTPILRSKYQKKLNKNFEKINTYLNNL